MSDIADSLLVVHPAVIASESSSTNAAFHPIPTSNAPEKKGEGPVDSQGTSASNAAEKERIPGTPQVVNTGQPSAEKNDGDKFQQPLAKISDNETLSDRGSSTSSVSVPSKVTGDVSSTNFLEGDLLRAVRELQKELNSFATTEQDNNDDFARAATEISSFDLESISTRPPETLRLALSLKHFFELQKSALSTGSEHHWFHEASGVQSQVTIISTFLPELLANASSSSQTLNASTSASDIHASLISRYPIVGKALTNKLGRKSMVDLTGTVIKDISSLTLLFVSLCNLTDGITSLVELYAKKDAGKKAMFLAFRRKETSLDLTTDNLESPPKLTLEHLGLDYTAAFASEVAVVLMPDLEKLRCFVVCCEVSVAREKKKNSTEEAFVGVILGFPEDVSDQFLVGKFENALTGGILDATSVSLVKFRDATPLYELVDSEYVPKKSSITRIEALTLANLRLLPGFSLPEKALESAEKEGDVENADFSPEQTPSETPNSRRPVRSCRDRPLVQVTPVPKQSSGKSKKRGKDDEELGEESDPMETDDTVPPPKSKRIRKDIPPQETRAATVLSAQIPATTANSNEVHNPSLYQMAAKLPPPVLPPVALPVTAVPQPSSLTVPNPLASFTALSETDRLNMFREMAASFGFQVPALNAMPSPTSPYSTSVHTARPEIPYFPSSILQPDTSRGLIHQPVTQSQLSQSFPAGSSISLGVHQMANTSSQRQPAPQSRNLGAVSSRPQVQDGFGSTTDGYWAPNNTGMFSGQFIYKQEVHRHYHYPSNPNQQPEQLYGQTLCGWCGANLPGFTGRCRNCNREY